MKALKALNLALKFLLEIAMLAAFCWWGFSLSYGWPIRISAGVGLPVLAAIVWGLLMAPRAKWRLKGVSFHAMEIVLFGLAALAVSRWWQLSVAFAAVYIVNKILLIVWKQ